jgi:hypothetical protein
MSEPDRRRKLVSLFTHRLPYKASAIFFALVLWLVVSAEEPAEQVVEVRFVPVLDSALRLVGARPEIRAIVAGPTRELLKLYASPPVVRRAFAPGTPDSVRVELRAGDVSLPEGVSATVLDVRPRTLALRFETLVERRVPVRSALRASAGVLAPNAAFVFEPESVTVVGPRRTIAAMTSARSESRIIDEDAPEFVRVETGIDGVAVRPERVRLLVRTRGVVPTLDSVASGVDSTADSTRAPRSYADSVFGRDSAQRVATGRAALARDSARRDSVRRETLRRERARQDGIFRRDSARRDSLQQDARRPAPDTATRDVDPPGSLGP